MRAPALLALLALSACQDLAYRKAVRSLQLKPPPADHGLEAQVLPSGLRLAVFQVPGQRDATLSLSLGAGRADEPDDKPGLARVALRAAVLSPRGQGGASLLERLYAAGALVDAGVQLDETSIAIRYRLAFQDAVVDAVASFLDRPEEGVEEDGVRLAREELAAALGRREDTAEAAAQEVRRLALAGTAFGRAEPTPQAVRGLGREDVRAFLRASFEPRRAVLWISSGLDAEEESRKVLATLGGRAAGDAAHPVAPEPGYSSAPPPERIDLRRVTLTGGSRPRLLVAWRAPGVRFGPAAEMAAFQLRETINQRRGWKELAGKVRDVRVTVQALDRASILLADLELETARDADVALVHVLGAARSGPALWGMRSKAELELWRQQLRLDRELELALGWMGAVGRLVRAVGSADVPTWRDLNEQSQIGGAVSGWMLAWLAPGPAVIATVEASPEAAVAQAAPTTTEGRGSALPTRPLAWPTSASLVAAAVPGLERLDQLLEPASLEAARRERLPNGLTLLTLRRSGAPFATLALFLPGGAVRVSEGLAANQALRAARAELEGGGCSWVPAVSPHTDGALALLSVPASWLPAAVEALACWGRSLSAPRLRLPSPDEARGWIAYEAAMVGGPMPAPSGGERWGAAYLDRLGRAEGAQVVLVGDFEPEAALQQLRQAFGRFRQGRSAAMPATPAWPRARRVIVQDVPRARQARAALLLRLPDQLRWTSASRATLSALVGEWAERTLAPSGLEVARHAAGVGEASYEVLELTGPAELVPAAAAEALRELGRLRERGPATIDSQAARWNAARMAAYQHDSIPGAASSLLGLAAGDLPLGSWNGFAAELRKVDPASIQALLRDSAVGAEALLLVGDAAALVPLLTREGLAPEVLAPPAEEKR